ncbi:hypothetical protein ACET3Z_021416 [Daucus carota]
MSLRRGSKVWVQDRDSAWVADVVIEFIGKQVQLLTEFNKKEKVLPVIKELMSSECLDIQRRHGWSTCSNVKINQ